MAVFIPGIILKELRESKNLTQNQLCEGICSASALSKIESGTRNPHYYTFATLMERLGCNPHKYYVNILSREEYEYIIKEDHVRWLIENYEYKQVPIAIHELEELFLPHISCNTEKMNINENNFEERLKMQFIIRVKCSLMAYEGEDQKKRRELLEKGIRLTISDYREDNIAKYLLSRNEIDILNLIALTYAEDKNSSRAIKILYNIKNSIDTYCYDETEKTKTYSIILYNLSKSLGLEKRHGEAMKICDIAIDFCRANRDFRLLPHIMFNKACSLFFSEDEEDKTQCRELITQAYYALVLYGNKKIAKILKEAAKMELDIEI